MMFTRATRATRMHARPLAIAICLLSLTIVSCAPRQGGFQMPPVPVEVTQVQTETVRDRFRTVGSVQANEIVKVVSEVNAIVRELPFAEGQGVARGSLIARFENRDIAAEAQRAEALRDQARTRLERVQQLFDQKAISPQDRDDASAAFQVADADFKLAQARLAKTRVVSPLNGVVGRRMVSPGAFLRVGDVITEVAQVNRMKVNFSAPERFAGQLRAGGAVEISTTAYPGQLFTGRLTVVDPILDPSTRTVQLVAIVENRGRRLRPGMSADVAATLSERANAMTVPDEAVFAEGDKMYVFLVKADSTVARQVVVIGVRDSARVEIAQGLPHGAIVVRAGYQKLFDGARIMPIQSGAGEGPAAGGPGAGGAKAAPATNR